MADDYYVDATLGGDGGTGEIGDPWKSIDPKVNGESYSGDDNINFKCGEEWREELSIPSSGSEGSPITFGSYGDGAKPIINGADLCNGEWTADLAEGSTWTAADQTDDAESEDIGSSWENHRTIIKNANTSTSGTQIRIKIKGHSSLTCWIDGSSIGLRDGAGEDYDGAPTRITWDTDNNATTITAGNSKWSDWMTFTFDETKDYLIHLWTETTNNHNGARWRGSSANKYGCASPDDDFTMTEDFTSESTDNDIYLIEEIEVRSGTANLWHHAWSTDYYQVFFDGVRGKEESALEDVDAEYDWYYDAGNSRLYVWCDNVGGPNAEYTSPGVEATKRNMCINSWADDYITITGLDLHYANFGINQDAGSEHWEIHGNDFSYLGKRGVYVVDSDYSNIYNNTFSYCGVEMPSAEYAIYTADADNVEIYENDISHSWNAGIKLDGGNGLKVYRNYLHDNDDAGEHFGEILITAAYANLSNVEVYYNLIKIGDGYGINANVMGHTITTVSIYNNTIWDNNPGAAPKNYVLRFEDVDTLNLKNNIIKTGREYVMYFDNNTDVTRDYNCYYGWTHATNIGYIEDGYKTWAEVSAVETNSINADPLMVDPANGDFHLKPGSPCINKGTDVGLTEDYDGNPVGALPDIGAFELIGAIATIPPMMSPDYYMTLG